MALGDVATWAAAAVAIGAAVIATVQARKANDSATRSASAAERSALADEKMAALAEEQAARYVPPWTLAHVMGDTYSVTNDSGATEYAVLVAPEGEIPGRFSTERRDLQPGERIDFMAVRTWSSGSSEIRVSWHRLPDCSDGERSWQNPLPGKPGRTR